MRPFPALVFLALFPLAASAQTSPQKGVEVGDMRRDVDPCGDFFEYANGAWRAANPIPASMVRWSRRWAAGEIAKDQLHVILDEAKERRDWPKASVEQLIGDHYASCMDEAHIEELGLRPLHPFLDEVRSIRTPAEVQRQIQRLHEVAIPVPFGVRSSPDNHEPTQVIANVYASGLGLPDRDYYLKAEPRFAEARAKYRAHVAKMFVLLGRSASEGEAAAQVVLEMETKLAQASLDNVASRDPASTDHKMTVASLQKLTPHLDWTGYFAATGLSRADLNVQEPKFLAEVDRQLEATPVAQWKTYLEWHLVRSAASALSSPFVNESFLFNEQYLGGAQEMKPRWKRCVESTDGLLGEALGRKYTDKHFPAAAKARMQLLVKNLLAAMGDTIQGLDWMGPETKKKALLKLSTFNPKIGYPDTWKDYSSVAIGRDAYWSNLVAGRQFAVGDDRRQIGKPVDRGRWGMTPPTSNAYYNALLNEIVFPAGILQAPAFGMDAIDAVNYGAIGVVIGHEISHGFDDQGAQYDEQGRLSNWWTPDDLRKFQARGQCVVDQFEGYFVEPGIHHNGKLVLGESIGDLAGARIAYLAFRKALAAAPPAPAPSGFTPDQQFFIAWGQFRGDAIRPETERLMVQSDEHPIGKYRVIGPLSNLPEFAAAFTCKAGSPMVRPAEKRCQVW